MSEGAEQFIPLDDGQGDLRSLDRWVQAGQLLGLPTRINGEVMPDESGMSAVDALTDALTHTRNARTSLLTEIMAAREHYVYICAQRRRLDQSEKNLINAIAELKSLEADPPRSTGTRSG